MNKKKHEPINERTSDDDINTKLPRKTTTSMFDLDEYSLIHIFSYLPFRDKILFATINRRFELILFEQFNNDKTYNLDLNYKNWSLTDLHNAFQLIGPITKSFQITENNETLPRVHLCIELILEFCCNLLEFKLECLQSANNYITQISRMLPNITYLELKVCSLVDMDIKILNNLKHIQHLDISKNQKVSGKYIENFSNLQTLILAECSQVKDKYLISIFSGMKSLKHFDAQKCCDINDTAMKTLIDSCEQMEVLKIYIRYASESVKRLSELKNLHTLHIEEGWSCGSSLEDTRRLRNIVNDLLRMLSNQLKSLKIHFLQFDYDRGLNLARFDSIYTMRNLHKLHLFGYLSCHVIDWENLQKFVENSNLKILNITYSNSALGFFSIEFNNFILHCIKHNLLDEINLKYSTSLAYPQFLDNFYKELDGKSNTKPSIQMKILVNKKTKTEILNNPNYLRAKDLSNLVMKELRNTHDDHFRYMVYEEDEDDVEDEENENELQTGEIKITLNTKVQKILNCYNDEKDLL